MRGRRNTPESFWEMADRPAEGCWIWRGSVGWLGYGRVSVAQRAVYAHRYAWELTHGAASVDDGQVVVQPCGNRLCVRPEHLELVSKAESNRRSLGTTAEAFWSRVSKAGGDGCWEWRGTVIGAGGYGVLRVLGRQVYAHRYAWELTHGTVPDGLQIDHLCRNRLCVNPAHLEPVPPGENVRRGLSSYSSGLRSTCKNGHALTPENRMANRDECRECRREWQARHRAGARERQRRFYYRRKRQGA